MLSLKNMGKAGGGRFNSLCDSIRLNLYTKYGNLDIGSNSVHASAYFGEMSGKLTSYFPPEKAEELAEKIK